MRTAIINTNFWKDDLIFELNTDTRLFYLAILTNPERNTSPAFKCSDRMMSTFTGYDKNILPLLRKQLEDKGLLVYKDGYYIITGNAYIKPTKGKLSASLIEKYMNELPNDIKLLVDELFMNGSGVVHEYKDKDNNKDIIKDKKYTNKEIELYFNDIWNLYNYKKDRKKSLEKFTTIFKREKEPLLLIEKIKISIPDYLEHLRQETWKQQKGFQVWLNGACWDDEYEVKKTGKQNNIIHTQSDKYANVKATKA